jgi:hypothetical protein
MAIKIPAFSILRPSKNTKIGIFGLKKYHLATMMLQHLALCLPFNHAGEKNFK